jgi:hypothetical protein
MTNAVVSNADEIRELTIDELDQAGGGIFPAIVACGVWFCVGYAAGKTLDSLL